MNFTSVLISSDRLRGLSSRRTLGLETGSGLLPASESTKDDRLSANRSGLHTPKCSLTGHSAQAKRLNTLFSGFSPKAKPSTKN